MDLVSFLEHNWFLITGVGALIAFTWKLGNQFRDYKEDVKEHDEKLNQKIDKLSENVASQINEMKDDVNKKFDDIKNARQEGAKRTMIMMRGIEATLVTLHNNGANGPVTDSLNELKEYQLHKATET